MASWDRISGARSAGGLVPLLLWERLVEEAGGRRETPKAGAGRGLPARLLGALALDDRVFREVAADRGALLQAALVVTLGGLSRGVAAFASEGWVALVGGVVVGLVLWGISALVIRGASRWVLSRPAPLDALLRALGFAAAPLLLLVLVAVLPAWIGGVIFAGAHALSIVAAAIAVRDACDTTIVRALLVCAAAALIAFLSLVVVGLLLVGGEAVAGPCGAGAATAP